MSYSFCMISKEEVEGLAQLARLKLAEGEVESLQKDISGILDYVGQASAAKPQGDTSLQSGEESPFGLNRNVLRADTPYPEGAMMLGKREALLKAFPKREGDYLVVRKIIQKDE